MSDDSFSTRLRNLSKDYYQNQISFDDYRSARKIILDQIDAEFNGHNIEPQEPEEPEEQHGQSIFMKTVSFFANTDLDEKVKKE